MGPCFRKQNSNPCVCGVHNELLVQRRSSEDSVFSKVGRLRFLCGPGERIRGSRLTADRGKGGSAKCVFYPHTPHSVDASYLLSVASQ